MSSPCGNGGRSPGTSTTARPAPTGFTFEIELRRVIVSKCREEVPAELRARIADALGLTDGGTVLHE